MTKNSKKVSEKKQKKGKRFPKATLQTLKIRFYFDMQSSPELRRLYNAKSKKISQLSRLVVEYVASLPTNFYNRIKPVLAGLNDNLLPKTQAIRNKQVQPIYWKKELNLDQNQIFSLSKMNSFDRNLYDRMIQESQYDQIQQEQASTEKYQN